MVCLIRKSIRPKLRDKNHTEADVVVAVAGTVVVPIRNTAVASVVVPTAATENAVRTRYDHQLYIFAHKDLLNPLVYAFCEKANNGVI